MHILHCKNGVNHVKMTIQKVREKDIMVNMYLSIITDVTKIIQVVIIFLAILALDIFLFFFLKRLFPKLILSFTSLALIASSLFDLEILSIFLGLFYFGSVMLFIFGNMSEFRWLFSNSVAAKDRRPRREQRKIYDQEEIANQLVSAVLNLSKTKMGALITIERSNELTDLLKNGTMINAPVTAALLTTIFYKGTTLHDGAVVIREDTILAASVYFTPSTKPLTGKVGSRHRAALGISEVTDAVTIVVSEETGRISFAYKGNLQPVNPDDFRKVLIDYLFPKY